MPLAAMISSLYNRLNNLSFLSLFTKRPEHQETKTLVVPPPADDGIDGERYPNLKLASEAINKIITIVEKSKQEGDDSHEKLAAQLLRFKQHILVPVSSQEELYNSQLDARLKQMARSLLNAAHGRQTSDAMYEYFIPYLGQKDYGEANRVLAITLELSLDDILVHLRLEETPDGKNTFRTVYRHENHALSEEIIRLPHANIAHDSPPRANAPICAKGTMEIEISKIKDWIFDKDDPLIVVIRGVSGTGKSTLLQTIAESTAAYRFLVASCFFGGEVTGDLIFPTLAYQLAQSNEEFAEYLTMALRECPGLAQAALPLQVEKLIIQPIQRSIWSIDCPILIILDCLDQCEALVAAKILQLLADGLSLPLPFKVLISTRPVAHLDRILFKRRIGRRFLLRTLVPAVEGSARTFSLGCY